MARRKATGKELAHRIRTDKVTEAGIPKNIGAGLARVGASLARAAKHTAPKGQSLGATKLRHIAAKAETDALIKRGGGPTLDALYRERISTGNALKAAKDIMGPKSGKAAAKAREAAEFARNPGHVVGLRHQARLAQLKRTTPTLTRAQAQKAALKTSGNLARKLRREGGTRRK